MSPEMNVGHLQDMHQYYYSGVTRPYDFRKKQLEVLRQAIKKYEASITEALYKDLHKSPEESYATEIGVTLAELSHTLSNLSEWMKPEKVSTPLGLFPSTSKILKDPLGLCLIIAPWNYPFQLIMNPLIGAIAGGNCIVLKPSEFTQNTSDVIRQIITECFDKNYISVIEGPGEVVVPEMMNNYRFDHVFFTGSIAVGKAVSIMAAEKLVPVTLELGGKSPCIVDKEVDLKVTADRIVWGKFTNAGQTCVAPDYLLVHKSIKVGLIEAMQKSINKFYGDDPQSSPDYGRIVNGKRLEKLQSFLDNGTIISGGKVVKEELYFSPTIMENVLPEKPLMQEEIFGPILPVFTFENHDENLETISRNPNPLALYVFSKNASIENLYKDKVAFGGGCMNNTLIHLGNPNLPLGGVGYSGSGSYHGKYSFDTFTRNKSIVSTGMWLDPSLKYPPYKGKLKFLKFFFK